MGYPGALSFVLMDHRLTNDEILSALGIDPAIYSPQAKLHLIHVLTNTANLSRNLVLQDSSRRFSSYLTSEFHPQENVDTLVTEVISSVLFYLSLALSDVAILLL